jgi:hypothetical protein
MGSKVCMSGSWNGPLLLIISAAGILVLKKDGNGRTGGMPVKQSAFENRNIVFFTGGGSFLYTTFSAFNVFQEIFYGKGQSCRATIDSESNGFAMRFAEDVYAEYASETVQCGWFMGLLVYGFTGL